MAAADDWSFAKHIRSRGKAIRQLVALGAREKEGRQMSEIPENIDQRFLAEQQARILGELAQVRSELNQVRGDLAAMQTGQEEISVEVATLAVNLRDIKNMLGMVEHQISIMKLRIDRIRQRI